MRGNSGRAPRNAISRQNAADAGARAVYQHLSTGDGGSPMTCHQARQQLAAYRRDDWTAAEMRQLAEHLESCAACRQVEAMYRRVGESIRQLPSIIPDAAFRESVFAAIAAERQKLGPAA